MYSEKFKSINKYNKLMKNENNIMEDFTSCFLRWHLFTFDDVITMNY